MSILRLPKLTTQFYIQVLLLVVCIINGMMYIPRQSFTPDEGEHYWYAISVLKGKPEKGQREADATTMPISVVNTPIRIAKQIVDPDFKRHDGGVSDVLEGRYFTLLLFVLMGILVTVWSRALYGEKAATFSLLIFTFCPNLNAYAGFVTNDVHTAFITLATGYCFWKWTVTKSWRSLIFFSVCFGIAQLTKQSLVNLFFIFLILFLISQVRERSLFSNAKSKLFKLSVFLVISLAVINAGFLFRDSFQPLSQYQFQSDSFKKIKASLALVQDVPLPFPSPFIEGMDQVKWMLELGAGAHLPYNYILGNISTESSWYHYLVVLLFKTPLIIIIIACFLLLLTRKKYTNFWRDEFLLLFIIAYFLFFFSFLVTRQVGVRHILMIFPFIYILLGKLITIYTEGVSKKIVLTLSVLYSIGTFYFYYPNLIAYTNELILDKKNAYRILAGTDLYYKNGEYYLEKYMNEHKDVRIPGSKPEAGKFIVDVNNFVDVLQTNRLNWLKKFKPVDEVYFSFLLFDVKPEDLE